MKQNQSIVAVSYRSLRGAGVHRGSALSFLCRAGIAGLLAVLIGCADKTPHHRVSSEELRKAMNEMNRSTQGDILASLGHAPSGEIEKIVQAAQELAKTSEQIPRAVEKLNLTEAERTAFLALASRLHEQALQLAAHAKAQHLEECRKEMATITDTCAQCHNKFRIPIE